MARKIPLKGTIATTNQKNGPKLSKAAIGVVNSRGYVDVNKQYGVFLLNPDSWEENKSSNWATNQINGQSDPVLQWTSGGPRIISFDALVTLENSDFGKVSRDIVDDLKDAALNAVGSIASNFFGVNVPPLGDFASSTPTGTNLSIANHLNYYRALLYPRYAENRNLKQSPPLIVLYAGNSFQGQAQKVDVKTSQQLNDKINTWVVTNLRIKITKQLMNLDPMEAIVSFQLMEYVSKSRSSYDDFSNKVGLSELSGLTDNLPKFSKPSFIS
jgi:hypothetical protein